MPAAYLHEVIALDARKRLKSEGEAELAAMLTAQEAALLTGAQGPDVLFFYKLFSGENKAARTLGERMHSERTADFLLSILRLARDRGDAARAYVLGFLSHYAADTVVHPYVYAHSYDGKGRYDFVLHCSLEAAMDTATFRGPNRRGIPRQMNGIVALLLADQSAIAPVLAEAASAVFPDMAINAKQAYDSFTWSLRIARLLYSPTGFKYRLFSLLTAAIGQPGLIKAHALPRRLPDWDFANLAALAWSSPWTPDAASRNTVAELAALAGQRSQALMAHAAGFWRGEIDEQAMRDALGDLHYSSGLPWRDTDPLYIDQPAKAVKPRAHK